MSTNTRYPVSQPSIGAREIALVGETLRANRLTQGEMVARFERAFGEALGVEHVIACANGTVALHLALAAFGIGPGDEVLVPDLTYVATVNAVAYTGATPVLVDVDTERWALDLADAAQKVCSRTRAILPVHLYGAPCDMDRLRGFAEDHGLVVIEDAAEGLGGSWRNHPLGTLGDCGTFSFYGNKVLTMGEGGAVVTNDGELAERLRLLRGQGQDPARRYWHVEIGFNYRLTEMQAAVGVAQVERLPELLERRRDVCAAYVGELGRSLLTTYQGESAPWLFTVLLPPTADRERVMRALLDAGIETRPAFVPLHRLPMYERPDHQFPIACIVGDTGLSLPTHPGMTPQDVAVICDALRQVLRRAPARPEVH